MKNFNKLKELLETPKRIVITTHHKPDGDAIGSSLALYHYLLKKGHKATVVSPTDYPSFLQWLPGNEAVLDFEQVERKAVDAVEHAQIIFCLELSSYTFDCHQNLDRKE